MLKYMLFALFALGLPAQAKEALPVLTSADGGKKISATPISVDGDKVVLRKASGKTLTTKLSSFSDHDRAQLMRWAEAVKKDPQHALVQRVKSSSPLRVLFIGNSYSFKIPKEFASLAKINRKKIHVEQVTKGGWTLAKHASSGETLGKIKNGKWDVVVLQEQSQVPSFIEAQRAKQMDAPARKLAHAVRGAGALPVFFLTWGRLHGDKQNAAAFPDDTMEAMQLRLNRGYANAAKQAGGAYIVPVGKIWTALMKAQSDAPLYSKDGSHPAKLGNILGAVVFYTALYNEPLKLRGHEKAHTDSLAKLAETVTWRPLSYPLPVAHKEKVPVSP